MNAQISACRTGERRVSEIAKRFGLETLQEAIEEPSSTMASGFPVPVWRNYRKDHWEAEDFADDDGINHDTMLKLKVKVTITDDEFIVDWTGSHPRTQGPMNLPIGLTNGVSGLAFKGITTPDYPANCRAFSAAQSHCCSRYPHACPAACADLRA